MSDQLVFLYQRWQTELQIPVGSMEAVYRKEYEREAGMYVAKLIKVQKQDTDSNPELPLRYPPQG